MTNDNREFREMVESLYAQIDAVEGRFWEGFTLSSAAILHKRKGKKPSKETMKMIQSIIQEG